GYKQEGLWWWMKNYGYEGWGLLPNDAATGSWERFVAPTVAEMGKALPNWNYTIRLDYEPYKNKWCALQKGGKIEVDADTEANARAKMYLYLKKEGLL
ncbi:hypothetical protein LCGC14_1875160, partial [marine sediment metagenome]